LTTTKADLATAVRKLLLTFASTKKQKMKIVVTGSLGHISKPLTMELLQKGHSVTVISSKPERKNEIENMGAKAAIGSIEDAGFLTATFKGADIVYVMVPPFNFFDHNLDTEAYWLDIAKSYVQAIQQSGVTKVVHLSSIGGHTDKGVGMLATHHLIENILKELPDVVSIKTMRPVGFYYNMFAFINAIKTQGAIVQNYKASYKEPWVSPLDIAGAIAEEMELPFEARKVRYIASDELTGDEVATILGEAIGKTGLKWIAIPDEQLLSGLLAAGFNPLLAKGLVEMNVARQGNGTLFDDYNLHKPTLSKVKLTDFAKEFAAVYTQP
jgi:uncharacterized protein YbjT (DUF2867 family)